MGHATMKRILLLFLLFVLCLLSFLWLRWQAQPSLQPLLQQAGLEVDTIHKEIWPALQLEGLHWQGITLARAEVSPAWWSLLRLQPALQLHLHTKDSQQSLIVGQTGTQLKVHAAQLQLSMEEIKTYLPIAAMLPLTGHIAAQVDQLVVNLNTQLPESGDIHLQTKALQLQLGAQAEALADIQIDVTWQDNMWHWRIVSDMLTGEGLLQQKAMIQQSVLSGKIRLIKQHIPKTLHTFIPSQEEHVELSLTGTLAAPAIHWL